MEPSAYLEVVRVVDRRFGAQGATFFEVLLDATGLVIHVQRWDDALGDDARTETAWGIALYASVEDELNMIGAAAIEVVANDLLEKDATA
jgi:hypothetical protein